jgi:hypothetical protein
MMLWALGMSIGLVSVVRAKNYDAVKHHGARLLNNFGNYY